MEHPLFLEIFNIIQEKKFLHKGYLAFALMPEESLMCQ